MATSEYSYSKILDGKITFASAELEISKSDNELNKINSSVVPSKFKGQGTIEENHDIWIKSAHSAITTLLENIPGKFLDIKIKKLEGRILIDTNNAAIGLACILAIYNYLEIKPSNNFLSNANELVKNNWNDDVSNIPKFEVLFS